MRSKCAVCENKLDGSYKNLCKKCYYLKNKSKYKRLGKKYRKIHKKEYEEYNQRYRQDNKIRLSKQKQVYKSTSEGKYTMYRGNAKRRGIGFNLTMEQFKGFWKKPCYYTGENINTIGIDRLDNSKGYMVNNCVSCCKQVNMMKGKMSKMDFIKICKIIARRF